MLSGRVKASTSSRLGIQIAFFSHGLVTWSLADLLHAAPTPPRVSIIENGHFGSKKERLKHQARNSLFVQIYRDKLRADIEGRPFVVPPPSEVSGARSSAPRRTGSSSSRKDNSWEDWGDDPAPKSSMRASPVNLVLELVSSCPGRMSHAKHNQGTVISNHFKTSTHFNSDSLLGMLPLENM